ncbi:MAG: AAA-like domain-containing protein [Acidobacteria bacterium]|nr:AAA-like domain-containing protein [Acidobacteriota bacterium]
MIGVKNRVGSPVRGNDFFGREKFVDLLWSKLMVGSLLLAAPRRFGKTSVLYNLKDKPRYGARIVHLDLEASNEPEHFVVLLLEALAREGFSDLAPRLTGRLKKAFQGFCETVEEVQISQLKLKLRDEIKTEWQSEGDLLLEKLAESNQIVIVVLDELPMMLEAMLREQKVQKAKEFLRWFRRARTSAGNHEKLRFVIAGSIGIDHVLSQLEESASINDFEKLKLEPFNRKTAESFLDELCSTYELNIKGPVRKKLLDLVGTLVPYFIQIFFSEIQKEAVLNETPVNEKLVGRIYHERILGVDCKTYFEHYHERLRRYFEPSEEKAARKLLREIAIVGEVGRDTLFQSFSESWNGDDAEDRFNLIIAALETDFYIRFRHEDRHYEFGSTLLRDWWLRYYSLSGN